MTVGETMRANVSAEIRGAVARLTINRPPLNILDLATVREMRAKLEEATRKSSVRLIEIRGAGKKAFSAGTEVRDHFPERAPEMLKEFHALVRAVFCAPALTLAVARGHCLGGGLELALACDFVLASTEARFGQPEIKLGAFPPVASVLLPQRVGEQTALQIILTGEPVTAQEACRWGLVNRVCAARDLDREVEKFQAVLLAQSAQALALAHRVVRLGSRQNFETALRESERIYLEELLPTEDALEGPRAFLEKRSPRWRG